MGIEETRKRKTAPSDHRNTRMPSHRQSHLSARPGRIPGNAPLRAKAPEAKAEPGQAEKKNVPDPAQNEVPVKEKAANAEPAPAVTLRIPEAKKAEPVKEKPVQKMPAAKKTAQTLPARKNRRKLWLLALALALVILIVIVIAAAVPPLEKGPDTEHFMDQIRAQEIKINDVAAVDDFFANYYTALSSGNTTAVEALFDDPSKAHVTTEIASIVSHYDNFRVYVTPGIEEGDIVAFVYNDIHFSNISATAPSVDSFYLRYNPDEAAFKICSDMYTDPVIMKFMNLVSYREPIRSLLSDTNEALNKALSDDKDLNNLFILMQSMTEAAEQESAAAQNAEKATEPATEE